MRIPPFAIHRSTLAVVFGLAKMVIVKLQGGLGNQLFEYAAGKAVAKELSMELMIDISHLSGENKSAITKRDFELDQLCIDYKISDAARLHSNMKTNWFDRLLGKNKLPVLSEKEFGSIKQFKNAKGDIYLSGYWQSKKYLKEIKEELRLEFAPAYALFY